MTNKHAIDAYQARGFLVRHILDDGQHKKTCRKNGHYS